VNPGQDSDADACVGGGDDLAEQAKATMSELWRRTAGELAAMIRSGDVLSREVVQAHLAPIG